MKSHTIFPYIVAGATGAFVASIVPLLFSTSHADTKLLPFQGRLTDASGNALPDGPKVVEFKIYDAPTGGIVKWAGEVHKLTVNGGLVNTMLGSKASFSGVDFSSPTYLQITIDANSDGQITAADPPLLPRQNVVPALVASFAAEAGNSRTLDGFDWGILFDGNNPATGKIPGGKIQDGGIGAAQLAAGAVTSSTVANGTIQAEDLAPGLLSTPGLDRSGLVIENSTADPAKTIILKATLLNIEGAVSRGLNLGLNLALSGVNGLDAGVAVSERWYYIWVINNPSNDATSGLLSQSSVAPIMPSGYTKKRILGALRTDASTNIVRFYQIDQQVVFDTLVEKAHSTSVPWTDLNLSDVVPPIARLINITTFHAGGASPNASNIQVSVRTKGSSSETGSYEAWVYGGYQSTTGTVVTDSNQMIQYRISSSGGEGHLYVNGFVLNL